MNAVYCFKMRNDLLNADVISAVNSMDEDDDITNCAKCRQLVTDPTTLPCLDSLCAKCFREICNTYRDNAAGIAACPRCQDPFQLPTIDIQTLPDRGFIDTLVVLKNVANQNQPDDNCDICKQVSSGSEEVAAAEYYCIECRQRMCASCATRHPLFSSSKNHRLVGLGLDSAKEVLLALKSFFPACTNHKDKYAAVHCYQCSVGLCSQCQNMHSSQYSSHELEVLTDDAYSQLTNNVKFLHDQLQQQFITQKEKTDQIQKLLFNWQNGVVLADKEINDKANEMISLIQKERDDLLRVLHSHNDQSIHSLEADSTRLSSDLSRNRKAVTFATELLKKGSVEDMLLNYRILNDRVSGLQNMSGGSSVFADSIHSDVLPASLIRDACTSLNSQSKFSFQSFESLFY